MPSLFLAAYPCEYLSTLDSTDHYVMQATGCVKAGLSWHGIYFAFTLSFVSLIFYQRPHSHPAGFCHGIVAFQNHALGTIFTIFMLIFWL